MPLALLLALSLSVPPSVPSTSANRTGFLRKTLRLDQQRVAALLAFEATDDTARIEKQLSALALTWVLERQGGCTAFLTRDNDGARLAAELFGELLHPRFASPRAAQWALWRAFSLQLHEATFGTRDETVARAWDDAFLRLVAAADPDAERAGLAAIASWERVVAAP